MLQYKDLSKSRVHFDEATHSYTDDNGKTLTGVTSVLKAVIYHSKYSGIPQDVLDRAAARGTEIHNACQRTDLWGKLSEGETRPEVLNYMRLKAEHDITMIANEYLVGYGIYGIATMIDCIDSTGRLYDIKTTRELDKDYVSWQLSLSAYLFEIQNPEIDVPALYAIWLRGDIAELVEVERKTDEEIEALIHDYHEGIVRGVADLPAEQETGELLQVLDLEQEIINFKEMIDSLESEKQKALASLKERMQAEGLRKIETPRLKLSLVEDSTSRSFDAKAFREAHPELAEQYQRETTRKGYVKITLKRG